MQQTLVNHKLLRVHQVRYRVDTVPYDLAWNAPLVLSPVPRFRKCSPWHCLDKVASSRTPHRPTVIGGSPLIGIPPSEG
jgi:hypothetical protein